MNQSAPLQKICLNKKCRTLGITILIRIKTVVTFFLMFQAKMYENISKKEALIIMESVDSQLNLATIRKFEF